MLNRQVAVSFKYFFAVAIFVILFATAFLFLGVAAVSAQGPELGINYVAPLNLADTDPRIAAVELLRLIITFLGIIAVVIVMYAGFLWMTSAGNEDKIARAKKTLVNAVIGLAVILAAFLIVSFVINRLSDALNNTGGTGTNNGNPGGIRGGLGASGNSVIEAHYPARNQQDVPRNTKIVITFKEPIASADLISGGSLNAGNVIIYKTNEGSIGPHVTSFSAAASADQKSFTFTQISPFIGSPSETVWYTVELTAAIHKANGDLVWPGVGGGYNWRFETGTFIDTTPPKITSIIPAPAATEPRNVIIQINFSEAIDPVSASGETVDFFNIVVRNGGSPVSGSFYISNEYRTVEFLTDLPCGTNSCGQTVYCLPGNANLSALVRAATLVVSGAPTAVNMPSLTPPYDGLVDMADNSLDGNKDGAAQGPETPAAGGFGSGRPPYNENSPDAAAQGDDYTWSFATNITIDTTPPTMLTINPSGSGADVAAVPEAVFSKILMSSSLVKNDPPGSGSVALYPALPADEVYYSLRAVNNADQTTVQIRHELFVAGASYTPEFNSGIKDKYQNCYNPASGPGCTPNPPSQPYCCNGAAQAASCAP